MTAGGDSEPQASALGGATHLQVLDFIRFQMLNHPEELKSNLLCLFAVSAGIVVGLQLPHWQLTSEFDRSNVDTFGIRL